MTVTAEPNITQRFVPLPHTIKVLPREEWDPGQVADIPKILQSRKEKRAAKAESRRDAKRRKLDRLRA